MSVSVVVTVKLLIVDSQTSPPRASKSSACFVFLDPSSIPVPFNAGLPVVTDEEETMIRASDGDISGASNREGK